MPPRLTKSITQLHIAAHTRTKRPSSAHPTLVPEASFYGTVLYINPKHNKTWLWHQLTSTSGRANPTRALGLRGEPLDLKRRKKRGSFAAYDRRTGLIMYDDKNFLFGLLSFVFRMQPANRNLIIFQSPRLQKRVNRVREELSVAKETKAVTTADLWDKISH